MGMEKGNTWCWDGVLLSYARKSGKASLIGNLRKVREQPHGKGKYKGPEAEACALCLRNSRGKCPSSLDKEESGRRRSQREEGLILRHLSLLP